MLDDLYSVVYFSVDLLFEVSCFIFYFFDFVVEFWKEELVWIVLYYVFIVVMFFFVNILIYLVGFLVDKDL